MMVWLLLSFLLLTMGLGGVAFVTLLERKLLGLSQIRLGPNKVSFGGLLQPVADGIKLLWKEAFPITYSQSLMFVFSPMLLLIFFIITWTWILPWASDLVTMKYSGLLYFSLLGLSAYAVILTGWSSISAFSKLGSLRGMLQSLSFEVALILVFLVILSYYNSFLMKNEEHFVIEIISVWVVIWTILSLMETNRAPFDLLEGESELISGFNIEMGSFSFVFLFLSEYGMVIVMSLIFCIAFAGELISVSLSLIIMLLFMRSCFPRIRYDIMMSMMWKMILPMSIYMFFMSLFL